jgi:hypothetical protein
MSIFQVSTELENRLPLTKGESRLSGKGVFSLLSSDYLMTEKMAIPGFLTT